MRRRETSAEEKPDWDGLEGVLPMTEIKGGRDSALLGQGRKAYST